MRKNRMLKCMPALALLAVVLLCGCSGDTAAAVTVDQSAVYAELGSAVILPAASADIDGAGDEYDITCTVYLDGKSVASFDGAVSNEFVPEKSGIYVAEYSAKCGKASSSIRQKTVVIGRSAETGDGVPVLKLSDSEASFSVDGNVMLRAAAAESSSGDDISADLKVLLLDCNSTVLFNGNGNTEQNAGKLGRGTYTAVYSVENGGLVNTAIYRITVLDSAYVYPTITAPTADVFAFKGQSLRISSAEAHDPLEGDVSHRLNVRIEDASGKTVFAEASAAKSYTYTFAEAGEYRVIYSCTNSNGKAAKDGGYKVTVLGTTSNGIEIDGKINEAEYGAFPSYRTGLGGNVLVFFSKDAEYLYIAARITDTTLIKSNAAATEALLNGSDGLEIMLDPENSTALNLKNTSCVRIRVGVSGDVITYSAKKKSTAWEESSLYRSCLVAVSTDGTVSVAGITKASDSAASDTDECYVVEMRIPWKELGFSGDPSEKLDHIGIAFGHRDVSSTQYFSSYGDVTATDKSYRNNCYYNGMHQYGSKDVANAGIAPAYYQKLYISGENLGVNPVTYSSEIILDGYMEREFWADAEQIPYAETSAGSEVYAFAKADRYGVYVGVYIEDSQLVAEPRGFHSYQGIKYNDRLDLRFVDAESMSLEGMPKAVKGQNNIINSKIIFLDPLGSAQMQMLQAASGRCVAQLPFAYATAANGTVGYNKDGNGWDGDGVFIADTDVDDVDGGWGVEVFMPWSTLGMEYPENGKTEVGILVSIYDRGADAAGAAIVNSRRALTGRAKSVISRPDTYYVLEAGE